MTADVLDDFEDLRGRIPVTSGLAELEISQDSGLRGNRPKSF